MEMTTIGAAIYKDIEQNEYLNKLYDNLLFNYGLQLFRLKDVKARELNVICCDLPTFCQSQLMPKRLNSIS